ncbi:MAG: biosynthetic-type acetolactate synthase large subunit [Bacteroidales bacterium]|jgi:acetolactate synthase-1/2/3 large subunit|nr:biosynthetic-type acetolactate synthase large subunit [Bacteroidales bacterium]
MKKRVKGSEAVLLALMQEGCDTIFGYPGGTIIPIYDDLYRYADKIKHILVRHEQGAVHAAEGYARSTGKTGVCMATSGPGATNFVTGIADAKLDSTPIVCISAQVNAEKLGTDFFQEADIIGITLPITKWSHQITSASEICETIAKAFYIARSGKPGPVVISITKNAETELTDFEYDKKELLKEIIKEPAMPDERLINKAAFLINNAEKPLIIAGQGIILSGAEKELAEISGKGNIPVATTLMGLSAIPTSNPMFVGRVGMHGNLAPNAMTQEADVIIAAGMRFSDRVTGNIKGYAPRAKIIHIEIDPSEIDKNVRAYLPLTGDVKAILASIIPQIKTTDRSSWMDFAKKKNKEEFAKIVEPGTTEKGCGEILMGQVIKEISQKSGGKSIIVTDVGQNQMFTARYLSFEKERSWITSGGLGTMGFGLPAAIGAKAGNPHREVIAIIGDGGFQMTMEELGTIMQCHINIKIVLMNNSFLGMVRQWQELFYDKRYSNTELENPDFQEIAQAYGIRHKRVSDCGKLNESIDDMLACKGPYFLEIIVKKEENVFPMVPAGADLNNIILGKTTNDK